jgi:hypothetical protein
MCNNWDRRNFLAALKSAVKCLCIDSENRRMSWILGKRHIKTVMIIDVLPTARKVLTATSFQHQ